LPLNRAYPFFALSFLFVPLLSGFLLGEPTNARYWVGIGLIVAGIWIAAA